MPVTIEEDSQLTLPVHSLLFSIELENVLSLCAEVMHLCGTLATPLCLQIERQSVQTTGVPGLPAPAATMQYKQRGYCSASRRDW